MPRRLIEDVALCLLVGHLCLLVGHLLLRAVDLLWVDLPMTHPDVSECTGNSPVGRHRAMAQDLQVTASRSALRGVPE